MPGITVGVDGSERSRQALEWAVREAGLRGAALTVLAVPLSQAILRTAALEPPKQPVVPVPVPVTVPWDGSSDVQSIVPLSW